MKVLMQSHINLFSSMRGDSIQVLKTKEYLERFGIKVDISLELEPDLSNYDIVHLFNITRPQFIYLQALNGKKWNKKVVLSPIFLDYSEYDRKGRKGIIKIISQLCDKNIMEYLKMIGRTAKNKKIDKGVFAVLKKGFKRSQEDILKVVDCLLPNSLSEFNRMNEYFEVNMKPCHIVPNGLDHHLFDPDKNNVDPYFSQFKGCVLCVAQIDGLKNQLGLLKAVRDLDVKLVFVGKVASTHRGDYTEIRKYATSHTYFLGELPHEKLPSLYAVAKVHALPSYFETTGLSSLEAGVMGCNVVVSERGDVREYFQNFAYYCDPCSIDSIRDAVLKAYNSPYNSKLKEHILNNFTWKITAKRTLEAYEKVLKE